LTEPVKTAIIRPVLTNREGGFVVWFLRSLIILVGVVAFLWVGMNNADQRVDFKFFNKDFVGLNLNLLLLLVFAVGMVFSFLIWVLNEFSLRNQISRQRREISRLEKELAALRSLPLEDTTSAPGESEAQF
jgi:uncharacterized membrane protein YciS (DUF1049 family)